jgi:Ig-like domain from next to BRCA1 gene
LIENDESRQRSLLRRLELGDLLIFLYAVAFIRQYLWVLNNNAAAWVLTVVLALVFSYFYVSTKQFTATRLGVSFWLIVGLPLLIAYAFRAPFPDHSYDVWSYHILQSDRALHGGLYGPGDYFPTALPFNPVSDMVMGLSRLGFGYRLGTIVNLFVLVWTAQIAERILRAFMERRWRYVAVVLILLTENVLFEISTYMVDLLTIPLLLQATLLTLNLEKAPRRALALLHIAVLAGAGVAFKLTNLAVAIPLLAFCAAKIFLGPQRFPAKQTMTVLLQMMAAFVAPLLPFTIYIYRLTGNPIFPIANGFFQSPFWPTHGGWDDRWGPQTFWQTLVWPVLAWFKPERHSELGVYSGRLSLAFVVALICLPLLWRHAQVRLLCIFLLTSALLWAVGGMGYSRYGLFEDLLGGLTLTAVVAVLATSRRAWKTVLAAVAGAIFVLQSFVACRYGLDKDWGERTTLIKDPDLYASELAFIFRDHSLRSFLTDEEKARFDHVKVWFETGPKSTIFEVLLNRRAPVIALRQAEFFHTREAWQQFIQKVEATGGHNMYSLCLRGDLENAKRAVAERGLELGEIVPVEVPFFSPRERIGMMFFEIRLPQDPAAREQFENAWRKAAFAASDYREEIIALNPPSTMRAGEKLDVHLKLKNLGSETWTAVGTKDFKYQIDMGNRWIRGTENKEDNRAVLQADLPPGGETELTMSITAPSQPGDYVLEFDMVHEAVTWFKERGGHPLSIKVTVTP